MKKPIKIFLEIITPISAFVFSYLFCFVLFKLNIIASQIPFSYSDCYNRSYFIQMSDFSWLEVLFTSIFLFLLTVNIDKNGISIYVWGLDEKVFLLNKIDKNILKWLVKRILSALAIIIYTYFISVFIYFLIYYLIHYIFKGLFYLKGIETITVWHYCSLYFYQWIIILIFIIACGLLIRKILKDEYRHSPKYYKLESIIAIILTISLFFINNSIPKNPHRSYFNKTIKQLVDDANNAMIKEDFLLANNELEKVISKDTSFDDYKIYLSKGLCNFMIKNYNESIKCINVFLSNTSKNDDYYLAYELLSDNYYFLHKTDLALVYINQAINSISFVVTPDLTFEKSTYELYIKRATCEIELRQFEKAKIDCDKAIEKNELFIDSYRLRGVCSRELGDIHKAIIDFETVTAKDTLNSLAYAGIGRCKMIEKDYKRAIQYFDKSLKLNPLADIYKDKYECKKRIKDQYWIKDSISWIEMKEKEIDGNAILY